MQCSALCNDSSLYYDPERNNGGGGGGVAPGSSVGGYQRIGEATEVALRVLAEKVRVPSSANDLKPSFVTHVPSIISDVPL